MAEWHDPLHVTSGDTVTLISTIRTGTSALPHAHGDTGAHFCAPMGVVSNRLFTPSDTRRLSARTVRVAPQEHVARTHRNADHT